MSTTPRIDSWVVSLMSLVAFLTALSNYSVQPFLPIMANDLGLSVPVIGQAATIPLFVAAVAGLAAGPFADLVGFKPVMVGGLLLIGTSAIGVGLAPTFEILMLARVLAGFGAAATVGPLFAFAGASHGYATRQRALSYVSAAFSVSAVLGIPLLTTIEAFSGWRASLISIGVAGFVLAVIIWCFAVEPARMQLPAWHGFPAIARSYLPLLRDPRMLVVFLGIIGAGMGTIGAITYVGAYFTEEYGTSTGRVGLLLALAGTAYTSGSVLGGRSFFDFRVPGTTLGLGAFSGLAAWAVFGFDAGAVFGVVALAVALLVAGILNIMFVTVLSYEANAGPATTMAMQASVTNLGSAIGVGLGGLALGAGGYFVLGLVVGASFLLTGVVSTLWFVLGPRKVTLWDPERGVPIVGDYTRPKSGEGEQR